LVHLVLAPLRNEDGVVGQIHHKWAQLRTPEIQKFPFLGTVTLA
jgi:hypothetical protein